MSVNLPCLAVVFGGYGVPQSDVVECRVHLGCTREVSSFELLLDNYTGKYSPGGQIPLAVGMDGSISIGRGAYCPQIITCRIESLRYEVGVVERYVRVSGRCWGERLFRRVFTGTFENMKGEAIVKHLLDYYVGLSHSRGGRELVEDTDTLYTRLEYENAPVWDIIKYIAESSDKNGVVGFDFRIAPDGRFEFFPRGSKTSPVGLSERLEVMEYERDISRVRNRIFVLGSGGKKLPDDLNEDGLSESTGMWIPHYPSHEVSVSRDHVSRDGEVGYSDSYSVQAATGGAAPLNATGMYRLFGSPIRCGGPDGFKRLRFWLKWNRLNVGAPTSIRVYLYTDMTNYFYHDITSLCGSQGEWRKVELSLEAAWGIVGNPSWSQIIAVGFHIEFPGSAYPILRVDHIVFEGARFSAVVEDAGSRNQYGLRELTETDEELTCDSACGRRAQALLAYLKDPSEHLTVKSTVLDYGGTPILPGDRVYVPFTEGYFRVSSVEYRVDGRMQTLEVALELGREPPLLADYLYGLRSTTVTVEKLARTKLGREAKVSRAPAGHDHAGDVLRPNIVNCNELTVTGKTVSNKIECNIIEGAEKITVDDIECNNSIAVTTRITAGWLECNYLAAAAYISAPQINCNSLAAAVGISADTIACNSLNVAGSVNCANWQPGDIIFRNGFRITEAENIGLPKGLAILNPEGKLVMLIDEKGNLHLAGRKRAGCI
ncbi:MAG: hypothetical protein N3F10_06585 [Candidatus Bathyarchaeota archaeon]|nr:hypothetical protein [Candidatus Bathyarchaeota archaeon]